MRLDLLVVATNEVLKIGRSPSSAELWKAFHISCSALHLLAENDEFFQLVQKSNPQSSPLQPPLQQVIDDLQQFEGFLKIEKSVLVEAGVESVLAEALVSQTRSLRTQLGMPTPSPGQIRVEVNKLRNESCEAADRLSRINEDSEQRKKRWSLVARIGKALGGATIAVSNASAIATIGAIPAAISTALGAKLLTTAFEKGDSK